MASENTKSVSEEYPHLNATALTFKNLNILIEVARKGSETKAAEALGMGLPDVSRALSKLEHGVHWKLRRNDERTTALTPEGQELVTLTQAYYASLNDLICRHTKRLSSVHIGAGDSLIHLVLPSKLSRINWKDKFKETVIHVSDLGRFELDQSLRNYSIDIGIFREELLPKERPVKKKSPQKTRRSLLEYVELGTYKYAIFVPQKLWRDSKIPPLNELPFAAKRIYWETDLIEMVREHGHEINVQVWCSNLAQVIRLVQEGNYAAVLPDFSSRLLPSPNFKNYPVTFLSSHSDRVVLAFNSEMLKIKDKTLKPFIDMLCADLRLFFATKA